MDMRQLELLGWTCSCRGWILPCYYVIGFYSAQEKHLVVAEDERVGGSVCWWGRGACWDSNRGWWWVGSFDISTFFGILTLSFLSSRLNLTPQAQCCSHQWLPNSREQRGWNSGIHQQTLSEVWGCRERWFLLIVPPHPPSQFQAPNPHCQMHQMLNTVPRCCILPQRKVGVWWPTFVSGLRYEFILIDGGLFLFFHFRGIFLILIFSKRPGEMSQGWRGRQRVTLICTQRILRWVDAE